MKKLNWNSGWKVWQDKNAFNLVFAVPTDAKTVDLPYDAGFYLQQDPACVSAGSTGFMNGAVFNYYKELTLGQDEIGKTFLLEIEGAMSQSFVYVNGSKAGGGSYGYTDYYVNITDYLSAGVNRILIVTDTMNRSSRYYAGCGLYRDVYLHIGDAQYIESESLRVLTKSADSESALIECSVSVKNTWAAARDVQLRFTVENGKGEVCLQACYPVFLHGSAVTPVTKTFCIPSVHLWSEDAPNLYTCRAEIVADGKVLDAEETVTGFRTLTVDAMHGLRVNGKTVKLRGACIHHDQGILGASTHYEYEYRRIRRLKEAGFNAVRSAHNPASKALLSACDRLGVYVMDEAFDMWEKLKNYSDYALFFEKGWEDVVRAMVRVDFNHPSVVLYSTGNEISEIGTERGYAVNRKMCALFHELDASRFTTNGVNGAFAAGNGLIEIAASLTGKDESEFADGDINKFMFLVATAMDRIVQHRVVGDILNRLDSTNDVMGYNYMTARYEMDHQAYPQRVMVGTETYPKQIAENWRIISACPAVIGDFTWTGYDYAGETGGPDAYPKLFSPAGDLDVLGVRRPMSYYRELVFGLTEKPYICVREPENFGKPRMFGPWKFTDAIRSWTFPGQEGEMVSAEVFSNGDAVELFLNDMSLGRKANGETVGCFTAFDLPYAPGVLKAVSYRDGKVIGEDVLRTSGGTVNIHLDVDEGIPAFGEDKIVFLNVSLLDEHGERVVQKDVQLKLDMEGNAELLAFGSIKEKHDNGFVKTEVLSGEGGALAILRMKANEKVTLRVSAENLHPAVLAIEP